MSKKEDDSELQAATLSPTSTNDEESTLIPKEEPHSTSQSSHTHQVNWSDLKMLVTGDSRAGYIDMNNLTDCPKHCFAVKDDADLNDIIKLIDQNISREIRAVLVIGFHKELTDIETVTVNDKQIELLKVNESPNLKFILETVKINVERWTMEYPDVRIIWGLPYPIDFYRYNQTILLEALDPETKDGISEADNILEKNGISEQKSRNMTLVHYSQCRLLLAKWRKKISKIPYYDLSETFFTNLKRLIPLYRESSNDYVMPLNRTINGLHASPTYVYNLAKHLRCKLKTAKVVIDDIKPDVKNVLVEPIITSNISNSFCDWKDEEIVPIALNA